MLLQREWVAVFGKNFSTTMLFVIKETTKKYGTILSKTPSVGKKTVSILNKAKSIAFEHRRCFLLYFALFLVVKLVTVGVSIVSSKNQSSFTAFAILSTASTT